MVIVGLVLDRGGDGVDALSETSSKAANAVFGELGEGVHGGEKGDGWGDLSRDVDIV